jgi:hypothetical protein
MGKEKIITLCGILDLFTLAWYFGWRLIHGQIPFYQDFSEAIQTITSFGIPSLSITTIISLFLYLSLALSGIFLIRHKKIGAVISYIQTPFRIFSLIPPSIFLIKWPLKYIFDNPKAVSAFITFAILLLLSEAFKAYSVITWRKQIVTA